jgi:hypothetical protein
MLNRRQTGSRDHGIANVIGIARPGRAPLLAAVYFTESNDPMDARNAIHRQVGPPPGLKGAQIMSAFQQFLQDNCKAKQAKYADGYRDPASAILRLRGSFLFPPQQHERSVRYSVRTASGRAT